MKTHIDKVGKWPVVQVDCPHSSIPVQTHAPSGILHTTEGWWQPSLDEFKHKFAPHFMIGKRPDGTFGIDQLIPVGIAGRATRGHNDQALVQIEMIAFSEETPWLPGSTKRNPNPETLEILATLFAVCRKEWGIPLRRHWDDAHWPRGGDNPNRHAGVLGKEPGWFGHGDMPAPDVHWDPGHLEWSKVFTKAEAIAKTLP